MISFKKVLISAPGVVGAASDSIDDARIPDGHVLIRNRYSLISSGTELACLRGMEYWFSIPGTPGYCGVGEIIGIGSGVTGFAPGDLVYTDAGHYGAYYYEPGSENQLIAKVPEGIPLKLVPYMRMASIALTSANVSDIQLGDRVLVSGLGVVGNFASQFAQLQGASVLCSEPCKNRVAVARQCGLKHFVDPSDASFESAIREFTDGRGFDTVIESSGRPSVARAMMQYIRRNGELILLGTPRGEFNADLTEVLRKQHLADANLTIKGAHEVRYPTWESPFVKHSRERNMRRILRLVSEGRLVIEPMITEIVRPDEAARAYECLSKQPNKYMSILFQYA